ncbi:hypothetical protein AR505_0813 [methanogenic archaeon ISO4-H5]|nr:hypothetical protein AR505_0813 [methanogenic archaeon ISO4-H5]
MKTPFNRNKFKKIQIIPIEESAQDSQSYKGIRKSRFAETAYQKEVYQWI